MKRREFIAGLAGAAAAWPGAVWAQERVRRVGVLMHTTPAEPDSQARITALAQALREAGWIVGGNLRIDTRYSDGDLATLNRNATALVESSPDVIVGGIGPTAQVLQNVSR